MNVNPGTLSTLDQLAAEMIEKIWVEYQANNKPLVKDIRIIRDNDELSEDEVYKEMDIVVDRHGITIVDVMMMMLDLDKMASDRKTAIMMYCSARSVAEGL